MTQRRRSCWPIEILILALPDEVAYQLMMRDWPNVDDLRKTMTSLSAASTSLAIMRAPAPPGLATEGPLPTVIGAVSGSRGGRFGKGGKGKESKGKDKGKGNTKDESAKVSWS